MKKNLIFCCVLVAVAAVAATDDCDMNCIVNGTEIKHIACGNKAEFGPKCPKNIKLVDMTTSWQDTILSHLNAIRNRYAGLVDPKTSKLPACRMARMHWDNELAKHAVLEAKQCPDDGNQTNICHGTDRFRISGQAVFTWLRQVKQTNRIFRAALLTWMDLALEKSYGEIFDERNSHVGCGLTVAPEDLSGQRMWFVCNFAVVTKDRQSMFTECKTAAEKCKDKPILPFPYLCPLDEFNEW